LIRLTNHDTTRPSVYADAWRALVVAMVCATALSVVGCDKKNGDDNGGSGNSDPVPVHGNARLTWDQQASSVQELKSLSFRVYVDNAASTLTSVTCSDTPSAAGYVCSGGLPPMNPGIHVLELASVLNGGESERSAQLRVSVSSSVITYVSSESTENGDAALATSARAHTRIACLEDSESECYDVRVVATHLGFSSWLTAVPDERVFFVEGERAVRVIANGALVDEPALTLESEDARIVGLAVDARFLETRAVFVARAERSAGESTVLSVTRYRELLNIFGEGARILTGAPFTDGAFAPLAVDAEGLVYIALPATASTFTQHPTSGTVWRVTRDGFVTQWNEFASPIFAAGSSWPTALAIDRDRQQSWLAGRDDRGLRVGQLASREWRHVTVGTASSRTSLPIPTFSVGASEMLLVAGPRLSRASLADNGRLSTFRPLRVPADLVYAAVEGPRRSVYVVVSQTGAHDVSILQLTPRI
jgi:hypothetical protein